MFYSYDYKATKGRNSIGEHERAIREEEEGAAQPQDVDLDLRTGVSLSEINQQSAREIPEERYSFQITIGGDDFTLVNFDSFEEGLMERFGVDAVRDAKSEYAEDSLSTIFERLCDEKFGAWKWGREEDYAECELCDGWVNIEDIYDDDYWFSDGGYFMCGDCVRESPDSYLNALRDNVNMENRLLTPDEFESSGWVLVDSFDSLNQYPKTLRERQLELQRLQDEHPGAHFAFDRSCIGKYPHEYRIWGEGIADDSEDYDSEGEDA
jgi:hypothetical protein